MSQYYIKKSNFTWKAFQSKDFIVYYQPGSLTSKNSLLTENKIRTGIEKAKKFTKTDFVKIPIFLFIVDNKKEFNSLTLLNHTAVSYSKSNTIIESYFLVGESHEFVHLISHQNWGNSHTWIMEGFAVYSDNTWNKMSLEKKYKDLSTQGLTIPLKELLKNHKFHKFDPQISYPQSGLLVKFLIMKYGFENFKKFWKSPDINKIYKISEAELETEWNDFVRHLK